MPRGFAEGVDYSGAHRAETPRARDYNGAAARPVSARGVVPSIRGKELEVPMLTPLPRLRPARTAPLVAALCLFAAAPGAQAQEHAMFVSVTDGEGNAVTDLTAEDIVVQWDGENLETTEFEAAGWPVRLTVFVDNSDPAVSANAVPQIREGLRTLLAELPPEIEVGFLTLARQPRWITRHTFDRDELVEDIANISPDAGSAATFNDALVEEANRIHDDDDREYYPVIVMVGTDGADGSRSQQGRIDRMVERLGENSAEVHTLVLMTGRLGAGSMAAGVGEALAPITRGSFERIAVTSAIVEKLTDLGRDIARKHRMVSRQYHITYRQPRNPSDQPRIGVATELPGLQVIPTIDGNVPARMPQR